MFAVTYRNRAGAVLTDNLRDLETLRHYDEDEILSIAEIAEPVIYTDAEVKWAQRVNAEVNRPGRRAIIDPATVSKAREILDWLFARLAR